jgi:hypothetical protein
MKQLQLLEHESKQPDSMYHLLQTTNLYVCRYHRRKGITASCTYIFIIERHGNGTAYNIVEHDRNEKIPRGEM